MVAHFSPEILENDTTGEISVTAQLCHQSGDYIKASGQALMALSLVLAGLRAAPPTPPPTSSSPDFSPAAKLVHAGAQASLIGWSWGFEAGVHAYSCTLSAHLSSVKQGYCFMLSNRSHKNSHSIYAISASGPSLFCPILYETCLVPQGACYPAQWHSSYHQPEATASPVSCHKQDLGHWHYWWQQIIPW